MWIAHRAISELFIFPAIALILAIVLVAAGNALSRDETLPTAIESLGGAGIAFAVFGFSGPRWRSSLRFVLSGPVALGSGVEGIGEYLEPVAGLVIDVSVDPGVKLITADGERTLVPLAMASTLHPVPRPRDKDDAWCRHHVLLHVLKHNDPSAWPGPS